MLRILSFFLLPVLVSAQILFPILSGQLGTAVAATPSLVNFSGMPSSETGALGTQSFAGTGACPTKAYCAPVADPSLASNSLVIVYTYTAVAGADIPTAASYLANGTATGDTWVHCGTDATDATHNVFMGCFQNLTATTGTAQVRLTWAQANTHVAAAVYQTTNTTASDGYNSGVSTTATTSWSTGSVTSTVSNDFFLSCAVGTITRNAVTAFTKGSQANITWNYDLNDVRDAGFCQSGQQTASGALNPAITAGTSNGYVGITLALKSGSQGTAPSGMYAAHIYHVSSAAANASNLVYRVPGSGNLLAVSTSGGVQSITAVSDATNGSWTACAGPVQANTGSNAGFSSGYYVLNPTPGLLTTTLTVSATGDTGPTIFYDVVGAATTQKCTSASLATNLASALSAQTYMTGFSPAASAGMVIVAGSQLLNTALLCPACGIQDTSTYGGQSRDGPSYPDQNNAGSHYYFSSGAPVNLTFNEVDGTNDVGTGAINVMALQAPGATLYPTYVKSANSTATSSGTSITLSYTPAHSGDLLVVFLTVNGITTGTFGVSDPTNGTYSTIDSGTNASSWRMATFSKASISASTVTITGTTGTTNTSRSLTVVEFTNATAIDAHTAPTSVALSSSIYNGAAVTSASANTSQVYFVACQGDCRANAGQIGPSQPWTQVVVDSFDDAAAVVNTGAISTVRTPNGLDNGGSGNEAIATVSVK